MKWKDLKLNVFLFATGGAAGGERAEQAGEGLRLGMPRDVQVLQVHRLRDALPGQDLQIGEICSYHVTGETEDR